MASTIITGLGIAFASAAALRASQSAVAVTVWDHSKGHLLFWLFLAENFGSILKVQKYAQK